MSDSEQTTEIEAGQLVVLSGPSGVGKSTVLRRLLERHADMLKLSVSATTRPPRPGEKDGEDYHFLSSEDFSKRHEAGEFLECVDVYQGGHMYGTLLEEVRPSLTSGKWVILEIDVDGTKMVQEHYPDVLTIFLRTNSEEEFEQRLRNRGTESEEVIQRRLEVGRRELAHASQYTYQIANETVDETVDQISEILLNRGMAQ